jgi:hypothetical protein
MIANDSYFIDALGDYTDTNVIQSLPKISEWGFPPLAQNDSIVPKCGTLFDVPGCNREGMYAISFHRIQSSLPA